MSLTLDDNQAKFQIRGYKAGQIQVNEKIYTESLIISPNHLLEHWGPKNISDLTPTHIEIAAQTKPAVLIIGTGEKLIFPNIELYGELINQGIGIEIMDTAAACRTYTILTAENRRVVAALIL